MPIFYPQTTHWDLCYSIFLDLQDIKSNLYIRKAWDIWVTRSTKCLSNKHLSYKILSIHNMCNQQ